MGGSKAQPSPSGGFCCFLASRHVKEEALDAVDSFFTAPIAIGTTVGLHSPSSASSVFYSCAEPQPAETQGKLSQQPSHTVPDSLVPAAAASGQDSSTALMSAGEGVEANTAGSIALSLFVTSSGNSTESSIGTSGGVSVGGAAITSSGGGSSGSDAAWGRPANCHADAPSLVEEGRSSEPSFSVESCLTEGSISNASDPPAAPALAPRELAAEALKKATRNFSYKLGEGGFGFVYYGKLEGPRTLKQTPAWASDLTKLWRNNSQAARVSRLVEEVAVKVLKPNSYQGQRHFEAEIRSLGSIRHPNLVRLLGYCKGVEECMLVYEYVPNGSLDYHLFPRNNAPRLEFRLRLKALLGAAKGLAHLHKGCGRPIIYRDFKTSNILVDKEFNAKLSDFGLAREGPAGSATHLSTLVEGTVGYVAPEYLHSGCVSIKSDIYSFGVVLLEIVSGRKASYPNGRDGLVAWAMDKVRGSPDGWKLIVDEELKGVAAEVAARHVIRTATKCIQRDPGCRPSMRAVVECLKVAMSFCPEDNVQEMPLVAS